MDPFGFEAKKQRDAVDVESAEAGSFLNIGVKYCGLLGESPLLDRREAVSTCQSSFGKECTPLRDICLELCPWAYAP